MVQVQSADQVCEESEVGFRLTRGKHEDIRPTGIKGLRI